MTINKQNKAILLFDGVCNLCNGVVNLIIDYDRENRFLFASLQSKAGRSLLNKYNLLQNTFESFVLVEGDRFYTKSTAALRVAKELKGLWKLLYVFIIIPKPVRDAVYTFIAKNRYKWFGKQDFCRVPTPELKARFLE